MNKYQFSGRSEKHLIGVHPDLVRVARRALELSEVDFGISEGLRTLARQKQLVAAGASQTLAQSAPDRPCAGRGGLRRRLCALGLAPVHEDQQGVQAGRC